MRTIAAVLVVVFALNATANAKSSRDDHGDAIAALAGLQSAVAEIVHIEDSYAVGRTAYRNAARRALGEVSGALDRVNHLLDQVATPPWQPAVEGTKVNLLEAQENLNDALGERELDDYRFDLTRALASLALAIGRPSQDGVLGGLSGALANTELAVPAGAVRVAGCGVPARAPAYGINAGALVYVALPRAAAAARVPANLAIRSVAVRGDEIVLYTAHAATCKLQRAHDVAAATPAMPMLYTAAQAHAGKIVYVRHCLQCHGTDLQGTAGPAVAGTDFLKTAKFDGWTLRDVRTTVFENMPFSDPGSLSAQQYADVMAFLLASSCYPAGTKPFPQSDQASFASIKLGPMSGVRATNPKNGTCAVK